jgi:hypothetical protein
MEQEQFRLHIEGIPTRDVYGYTFPDGDVPGRVQFRGKDLEGRPFVASGSYDDAQVETPSKSTEASATIIQRRHLSAIVEDCRAPSQERVAALHEWMAESPADASNFILRNLSDPSIPSDLRDSLVFLAEQARYTDPCEQDQLVKALTNIATNLMNSTEPTSEHVVWSAIRRVASILPASRLDDLRCFLRNSGKVDTRIVALQGIVHAFESKPGSAELLPLLCDRIYEMAVKLTDEDVLTAGESSAVLELAICALYALGDPRAAEAHQKVRGLGWDWLTTQVDNGLRDLRDGWEERSDVEHV